MQPGIFQVRGDFLQQGHLSKHLIYNTGKKGQDTLKTGFRMGNLTHR